MRKKRRFRSSAGIGIRSNQFETIFFEKTEKQRNLFGGRLVREVAREGDP